MRPSIRSELLLKLRTYLSRKPTSHPSEIGCGRTGFAGATGSLEGGKFHPRSHAEDARNGPVDQRKIACFASRKPWVQIPAGPSSPGSKPTPRGPNSIRTWPRFRHLFGILQDAF